MSKAIKKDLYPEKIKLMKKRYQEIPPTDFYRMLFPEASFQKKDESDGDYKSNGMLLFRRKGEKKGTMHTSIIFDEHDEIEKCVCSSGFFENCEFAIISGCSYIGRRKINTNARKCYTIIIDIDQVDELRLSILLGMAENDIIPTLTAVAVSGNGVHVYYVLDKPIKLFKKQYDALCDLKRLLCRKLWNANTSLDPDPQFQGLTQGYRVVGTKTKRGHIVRAFLTGEKISVEKLIAGVYELDVVPYDKPTKKSASGKKEVYSKHIKDYVKDKDLYEKLYTVLVDETSNNYTLDEAKKLFPDWYERRIVNGEPPGHYVLKTAVYEAFLKTISSKENVSVGHRWNCMYCLAAFAQKCDIPEERFITDLGKLLPIYQSLSDKKEDEFTPDDVKAVISVYRNTDLIRLTKKNIEYLSGIKFKENKRTMPKKKQKEHLKDCREIRDAHYGKGEHWYDNGGRPSKEGIVAIYMDEHPDATNITQIAKECGVSRPTVYKYLNTKDR